MSEPGGWPAPLLTLAGRLIEEALSTDPDVRAELGALEGRAIHLVLEGPGRELYLLPERQVGLRVAVSTEVPVGVRIAGSPLALLGLARGAPAAGSGVEVSGDLALSQRLQRALGRLEIDWEELLARRVGDQAARRLAQLGEGLRGWLSQSRLTLERNVSEYARFEADWLPTRAEVGEYVEEVDRLRMGVDRLEQRVARLARTRGRG